MRTDLVSICNSHNTTLVESYLEQLRSGYRQTYAVHSRRGMPHESAREWTLYEMNMRQAHLDLVNDPDPLRLLSASLLDQDAAGLRHAELYVVSPAMHATIVAACATLSDDDLALWQEQDLPSLNGLLVFPHIQHFHHAGAPEELLALSWRHGQVHISDQRGELTSHSTLFATAWVDRYGPLRSSQFDTFADVARANGDQIPSILPIHRSYGELDSGLTTMTLDRELDGVRVAGPPMEAEFAGEAIEGQSLTTWMLRYLMAFTRLSGQKKVTRSEPFRNGVDARSKPRPHHDVRVVQLRSYEESPDTPASEDTGEPRGFTKQWVVKMHKVNYWYPSQKVHKIGWRGPYIKGPKGAPLMTGEKVYKLD